MITVVKNDKESVDRVISRFNKKVQASRILLVSREKRYRKKALTKRLQRKKAIMREFHRAQKEKKRFV
jgi:ribosomal protein S21